MPNPLPPLLVTRRHIPKPFRGGPPEGPRAKNRSSDIIFQKWRPARADSSFPPKPPPPTGGYRAQYDRPQSAYLPAQGTGHPTLVGFSSEGDSPRKSGGVSPQIPDKNIPSGQGRPLKPPLPTRAQRNRVWFDTLDFFGWFGSASVEASRSRCPPPDRTLDWGWGFIRFPHTWDGPRLGVSAHERGATIPAIFFHTECNPPRGPKARPAPLPTWCTPLTRGLT